jgi:hypothetical protein
MDGMFETCRLAGYEKTKTTPSSAEMLRGFRHLYNLIA